MIRTSSIVALLVSVLLFGCYEVVGPSDIGHVMRRVGIADVHADRATLVFDLFSSATAVVETRPRATGATPEPWIDHVGGGGASTHHEIELSPLSPRTTYEYRIQLGGGLMFEVDELDEVLDFRTPSVPDSTETPVAACALVISDTQGSGFDEVLGELEALRTDVDFVLSLGDQVGIEGASTPEAEEAMYLDYLLGPLSALTAHAPLLTVVGNHDAANASLMMTRDVALDLYTRHLVLPHDGPPEALPETVYSFDWEAFHIAVLDSTGPSAMRERGTLNEGQLAWMAGDMAAVEDRWRVVALHHMVHGWDTVDVPPLADWFHVDNFDRAHEAFLAAGVDLVLNGHRHSYNVFVLDGIHYVTFPTLARDEVLFDREGAANWQNRGGEAGTLDRAVSDVFGFATICGDATALTMQITLYDALRFELSSVAADAVVFTR